MHSLALFEDEDVLCLSDREGQRIDCIRAGLRVNEDNTGEDVITYTGVGRTFAIAAKGNILVMAMFKTVHSSITVRHVHLIPERPPLGSWNHNRYGGREAKNPRRMGPGRCKYLLLSSLLANKAASILISHGRFQLSHPHDLAISSFGDSVYVADVEGPTRLHKFEVVRTGDFP